MNGFVEFLWFSLFLCLLSFSDNFYYFIHMIEYDKRQNLYKGKHIFCHSQNSRLPLNIPLLVVTLPGAMYHIDEFLYGSEM